MGCKREGLIAFQVLTPSSRSGSRSFPDSCLCPPPLLEANMHWPLSWQFSWLSHTHPGRTKCDLQAREGTFCVCPRCLALPAGTQTPTASPAASCPGAVSPLKCSQQLLAPPRSLECRAFGSQGKGCGA